MNFFSKGSPHLSQIHKQDFLLPISILSFSVYFRCACLLFYSKSKTSHWYSRCKNIFEEGLRIASTDCFRSTSFECWILCSTAWQTPLASRNQQQIFEKFRCHVENPCVVAFPVGGIINPPANHQSVHSPLSIVLIKWRLPYKIPLNLCADLGKIFSGHRQDSQDSTDSKVHLCQFCRSW